MEKKLNVNTFVVLFALNIIGCKLNQNIANDKPAAISGVGGITVSDEREYTNSELEIARRICSNLKKKREFFETLTSDKPLQFRFRAELRNCDDNIYNTDLFVTTVSNANSTEPEYIANRENYFKDVVTDQSGIIKKMCDAFLQSDKVSNAMESNNFKYSINFIIADGFDRVDITKAQKNAKGGYDTLSSESVSVISNKSQIDKKFLGVEKERVRYTVCGNKKFQTLKQNWIESVTKFENED